MRSSWGPRFEAYARNNVLATQRLFEAAAARPPRRFVFASSSSVYGRSERLPTPEDAPPRPLSPYGVTKLAAEHLCAAYQASHGLPVVGLRYFSVYGPRQRPDMAFARFCRAAIDGRPVTVLGDGRQTRDFTFVEDVVAATRRAAEVEGIEGRVYNVGGGGQVSVRAAIELLGELAGRPLDVEHAPPGRGDARDTCADTSRARAELGIAPAPHFEDGLAEQLSWTAAERSVPA